MSERPPLGPAEQRALLTLARGTIVEHVRGKRLPATSGLPPALLKPGAAFVSLHVRPDGELRGCIGTFADDQPLADVVQEMAIAAATRDPRFPPVEPEELGNLEVEISVLSAPRPIRPHEVIVGLHGLRVARGRARGVLLPQVPVELGWDRETFLAHTCRKAGLPTDAWRDPATTLEAFTAQVFGEATVGADAPAPVADATTPPPGEAPPPTGAGEPPTRPVGGGPARR